MEYENRLMRKNSNREKKSSSILAHLKCLSASLSRMSSEAALVGLMCLELCSNWRMRSSRFRMRIGPGPSGSPVEKMLRFCCRHLTLSDLTSLLNVVQLFPGTPLERGGHGGDEVRPAEHLSSGRGRRPLRRGRRVVEVVGRGSGCGPVPRLGRGGGRRSSRQRRRAAPVVAKLLLLPAARV